MIRGINNIAIESACSWATPLPVPIPSVNAEPPVKVRSSVNSVVQANLARLGMPIKKLTTPASFVRVHGPCLKKQEGPKREKITAPVPFGPSGFLKTEDLPDEWDWSNVNGTNYLTVRRNQHIPQYCGSCWAHGSTSSLNARMAIMRKNAAPEIVTAPQYLINCNGGGTCDGGDPGAAFSYIHDNGIVSETCNPYQAVNGLPCSPACKWCHGGGQCPAVPRSEQPRFGVGDFGGVSGEENMMKEIVARGPIACSIDATSKLEAYTGGVFEEFELLPIPNHIIMVYGFGVDKATGKKFWRILNSWGTYYGEQGTFRIIRGNHLLNLGVEADCDWAVPVLPPGY